MFKKDNLKFGILLGILGPLLAMVIYYFWVFSRTIRFSEYLYVLTHNKPAVNGHQQSFPCWPMPCSLRFILIPTGIKQPRGFL